MTQTQKDETEKAIASLNVKMVKMVSGLELNGENGVRS
jgi:hypothetical protein